MENVKNILLEISAIGKKLKEYEWVIQAVELLDEPIRTKVIRILKQRIEEIEKKSNEFSKKVNRMELVVKIDKYLKKDFPLDKPTGIVYKEWWYQITAFINGLDNLKALLNKPIHHKLAFEDYVFPKGLVTIFEIEKFDRDKYERSQTYKVGMYIELKYIKFKAYFLFEIYDREEL